MTDRPICRRGNCGHEATHPGGYCPDHLAALVAIRDRMRPRVGYPAGRRRGLE